MHCCLHLGISAAQSKNTTDGFDVDRRDQVRREREKIYNLLAAEFVDPQQPKAPGPIIVTDSNPQWRPLASFEHFRTVTIL